MLIGHFALAPLAATTGRIKLWHGIIAAQLVDFLWATFVLLGIEKVRIDPGNTEATPLDMHFMPYTHSLLFSVGWAVLAMIAFKVITKSKTWGGAILVGVLVLSHWFEDLIVHIPDLALWPGSKKFGLGLWQNVMISFPFEILITLGAFAFYLIKTKAITPSSKIWGGVLIVLLLASQIFGNFGPPPGSVTELAVSALLLYSLVAFLAARLERTRRLVPPAR